MRVAAAGSADQELGVCPQPQLQAWFPLPSGALTYRRLASAVLREATTVDGVTFSVWAYMKGARPSDSLRWALLPGSIGLLWAGSQYLRYRLIYGGSWTIEIRRKDARGLSSADLLCTSANRRDAYAVVDAVLHQMKGLRAEDVPHVRTTLESCGCRLAN